MSQAPKRKRKGCLGIVLLAVLLVIIIAIVASAGAGGASYKATFQSGGIVPISASQVKVYITVDNTGKKAGTPSCTIHIEDPVGNGLGVDGLTATSPIGAGKQASYTDTITVSDNDAQGVTVGASSVKCS